MDDKDYEIIGITKDFHFSSLQEKIGPLFFVHRPSWTNKILTRIESGNQQGVIESIKKLYHQFNPGYVFEFHFLDQRYRAQYQSEMQLASLSKYFAILAIFISCLGLFGLATFNAKQRVKEIGIRKILGASLFQIIAMLSKGFLKIITLSIVIATPISWFLMSKWLEAYAYKIDIQVWVFLAAAFCLILTALLTISYQCLKTARANPINALKEK